MPMPGIEARGDIDPESIKRLKPITVLEAVKKVENGSGKSGFSVKDKIVIGLWTDAIFSGDEGFHGRLFIDNSKVNYNKESILTVQIEPHTEADKTAIENFNERIEDAMRRYDKYRHPGTNVPDATDYSNQTGRFKRFYLTGLDGTPPERI